MKKFYFLTLFIALTTWVSGQTFLSEDFSGGNMPPTGWSIDDHAANWSNNGSANAGGEAPEAKFFYDPSFVGITRLITPEINTTGITMVAFSFKHFLDDYSGTAYTLRVQTRSGRGDWSDAWSVNPTGDIGPIEQIVEITNADVGQADFQVAIVFDGNSYNLDNWFIDDVLLFAPYPVDAAMSSITTPSYVLGVTPIEGSFVNMGSQNIETIDVNWAVDGGMTYTTSYADLSIPFGEQYSFSCSDLFSFPIGAYNLEVWVSNVNNSDDDNPDNDLMSKTVNVVSHTVAKKPLYEEFTSATCAPCASFNSTFVPWCNTNADDMTLLKYQMNWPGNGDIYYTAEGGVRRTYYGVSYVPWLQAEGLVCATSVGAAQAVLVDALAAPAFASLVSTHSMDGTTITVDATVLPYAGYEDFVAHIVVFEYLTTGNVSTNGETEFEHVMMKMLPDAEGTMLTLNDREPVTISETFDMASTNVEEFDDLGVGIVFQDYFGQNVFQSAYSQEDAVFATEAHLSALSYDGMPFPGFDPDVFEYTMELEPGSDIPVVTATADDPNAIVIVEPATTIPGMTYVDVFAQDLMTKLSYTIEWDGNVGIKDPVSNNITAYPNPTEGILNVYGAENSDITVFNVTGMQVAAHNGFVGTRLDLSDLPTGIYILKVITEDKNVFTKKVTIK